MTYFVPISWEEQTGLFQRKRLSVFSSGYLRTGRNVPDGVKGKGTRGRDGPYEVGEGGSGSRSRMTGHVTGPT